MPTPSNYRNFVNNEFVPATDTFARASTATTMIGNQISTVAAGVARFENGLIIEAAATNIFLGNFQDYAVGTLPANLSVAAGNTCTVSTDVYALTGTRVLRHTCTSQSDGTVGYQTIALNGSQQQILASVDLWIPAAVAQSESIVLNLEYPGGVSTYLVAANFSLRNQWQRLSTSIAISSGQAFVNIVLRTNAVTPIYSTAWNCTAGPTLSSRIPAGGGSVTRATEHYTLPPDGYNRKNGAIFVDFDAGNTDLSGYRRVLDARGDDSNRIFILQNLTGQVRSDVHYRGAQQLSTGSFAYPVGGRFRFVLFWSSGVAQTACNGVLSSLDSDVTMPSISQISIGGDGVFAESALNGRIREYAMFGQSITADEALAWSVSGLPAPASGALGSAMLTPGKNTWLWRNPGASEVVATVSFARQDISAPKLSCWIGSGAKPSPHDCKFLNVAGLIERSSLIVAPGQSVWVSTDSGSVSASLVGL
jgi:hypothetical protein